MNREIKFRIWDKIRSCYAKQITTYKLDRNNNINLIIYLDKTNKMQEIKECDKIYTNEFIIQQYTGLKDKNYKEIYEGDIVKNYNQDVMVVKYISPSFVAEYFPLHHSEILKAELKVIGNICENKNLLKRKK